MDLPFAVYLSSSGSVVYITGDKLTDIIRKAIRKACPRMPKKGVQLYSCHSISVLACIDLFEAGMSPSFIRKDSDG